jgi:hypothetical protein
MRNGVKWIDEREKEIMARHAQIREKQDRRLKPWEHRMGSEEEKYEKVLCEKERGMDIEILEGSGGNVKSE